MAAWEDNERYMKSVQGIASKLKEIADKSGDKFAHAMIAADVLAEVIWIYPPEQRQAITDMMITRLGNSLDRRFNKEVN